MPGLRARRGGGMDGVSLPFPSMRYTEKLAARIAAVRSRLCVGLDPRPDLVQGSVREFLLRVIAESAPHAACFKPNIAYFEAMGSKGIISFDLFAIV